MMDRTNVEIVSNADVRKCLDVLAADPGDPDGDGQRVHVDALAKVRAWCVDRGFLDAVEHLDVALKIAPAGGLGIEVHRRLTGLRLLLGADARSERVFDRYDLACGSEDVGPIDGGEEVDIRIFPQVFMTARRVVVSCDRHDRLVVTDLYVGNRALFGSADPVAAEMFTLQAPECFSADVFPNQPVTVRVKNLAGQPQRVIACALGDLLPDSRKYDPKQLSDVESLLERAEKLLASDARGQIERDRGELAGEIRLFRTALKARP